MEGVLGLGQCEFRFIILTEESVGAFAASRTKQVLYQEFRHQIICFYKLLQLQSKLLISSTIFKLGGRVC